MRQFATLPIVNDHRVIIIDAAFYPILSRYPWYIPKGFHKSNPRPYTSLPLPNGKRRYVALARWVSRAQWREFPKHMNDDALDCRRENLWLVKTRDEAGMNSP